MARKKKNKRVQPLHQMEWSSEVPCDLPVIEIPRGDSREDKIARKQIIKDFYSCWVSANPDKRVWNLALKAYIYVKGKSMNETSGRASTSYESTLQVLRLTDILSRATLIRKKPPKRDSVNQKPYSEILIMRQKGATLVVGKQKTTGEYVQYCVSATDKK